MPRLAHQFLYRLLLAGTLALSWLPARWVDAAAAWVARRFYRLGGRRQRQLRANLRIGMGAAATDAAVDAAAAAVYASYARYMVEFFTLAWPDLWGRHSRVKPDTGPLEAALSGGAGVVLFSIHMGNWDLAGSECARRFGGFHSVGEQVEPLWLGMLMNRMRRTGGIKLHEGAGAARELLRALRKGEIVGLVADRTVVGKGVEVELCGRATLLPTGPVSLAIRTGAPFLPTCIERAGNGDLLVEFLPAVDLSDLGRGDSDVAKGVQRMADQLTALIQRGHRSWYALQPIWRDEPGE